MNKNDPCISPRIESMVNALNTYKKLFFLKKLNIQQENVVQT